MLTQDEKELLDALKEQMDDEQREALDAMSDEEKEELLMEAKQEMRNTSEEEPEERSDSARGLIRKMRKMSFKDFLATYGKKGIVSAALFYLVIKMTQTKKGCAWLVGIVFVVIAVFLLLGLSQQF